MSTPETIYLIPGEYEEGLVWCDDPAPDSYSDPDDAVKYVRADHIPDAGKVITDNSKVNAGLIAENERLQARLAELEGSEMTCIKTLVDIRFACGDDGKRMQGELVEYIAELSRKAVSVPEWIKCSEQRPNVLDVWIKMTDGSVVACWAQLDGDFYWKGGGSESFILEHTVTHWKPRQEEQGHE